MSAKAINTIDIVILHPAIEGASPYSAYNPKQNPGRFLTDCRCRDILIRLSTMNKQLLALATQSPDVVINLCDGSADEDQPGLGVVLALERLGIPFTGAGSRCFDISRNAQKMAAYAAGFKIPPYVNIHSLADMDAVSRLRYPLIVKHPHGYCSVGLNPGSLVWDFDALMVQTQQALDSFNGALIEEFIVGREFTALVVEPQDARQAPQALEPLEFVFPQGQSFRHFDIKWIDYSKIQLKTVDNLNLNQRIRQLSSHTFLALGLEGYARCDIRMDENGELFFLEINANPSMFYPEDSYGCSDVILLNDPMGHRGFIERIVAAALRRHESNQKSWRVDFDPQRGFGLYANRPIAINELVLQYELQPVTLASRSYIEKNWRGPLLQWFDIYAYPISERVSAVWDNKPEDWRPINHSCNPNLWLDGLDCVARYPIATGEELTLDYATFCGPGMAEFDCACGAVECRGVIRGTDCYLTELIQRYGNRVTDYVQFERSKVVHPGDVPYEIRPTPYGVGLFALRIWKINQKIANLRWGTTHDKPTRWTIQRDTTKHAEPIPHELRYINHGCDPNVFFDVERRQIIALVDIRIGDELKFFYPSTEWRLQEPFDCVCGSPRCLGAISGANGIANSILTRYRLAEHIQQLALTQSN